MKVIVWMVYELVEEWEVDEAIELVIEEDREEERVGWSNDIGIEMK